MNRFTPFIPPKHDLGTFVKLQEEARAPVFTAIQFVALAILDLAIVAHLLEVFA